MRVGGCYGRGRQTAGILLVIAGVLIVFLCLPMEFFLIALGVAMAAALSRGIDVFEYAPMRIKQSITGRGSAAKEQVASIVCRTLTIDQPPKRLDATDGMAVALCHYFTTASPLNAALGSERVKGLGGGKKAASKGGSQSWEQFLKKNPDREIK